MSKKSEIQTTAQKLNSIIKSCRQILRKDKGLSTDVDRLPQLIWMMFLKFLDDLEFRDEDAATLSNSKYVPLIPYPYRWRDWASKSDGITGEELIKMKLFCLTAVKERGFFKFLGT